MPCRGVCTLEKQFIVKPKFWKGDSYKNGFVRCSVCEIYTKSQKRTCLCCGRKFRRSRKRYDPRKQVYRY